MTIARMVELLAFEHACMLRNSHGDCDRHCENCNLVQDDGDLNEMYTDVISLLKAQEPVKPVFERIFMSDIEIYDCGKCGTSIGAKGIAKYCMKCGQAVKWE